jgi:hypothetical protein
LKKAGAMAADIGLEGGGATAGQIAGGAIGGPPGVVIGGAIGGGAGNAAAQMRQRRMGERDKFSFGEMGGAAVAAMIPGTNLAKAPAGAVVREMGKQAGGNMIAKAVETGVGPEHRLPTAKEMAMAGGMAGVGVGAGKFLDKARVPTAYEEAMAGRDAVLRRLRPEKVVVPPHEIDRGSDMISTWGGLTPLQKEAIKKNQPIWNRMAREELGYTGSHPLLDEKGSAENFFKAARKESYEPYETLQAVVKDAKAKVADIEANKFRISDPHELAAARNDPETRKILDPLVIQASADVDVLKKAREDVFAAYQALKAGGSYEVWQAAKIKVDMLEANIDEAAKIIGDNGLAKRLKESRTRIAKSYNIQEATNPSSGLVDDSVFGKLKLEGAPLSGKLLDMADFALTFRREAVEAGRVQAPGVGNIGAHFAAAAIAGGANPTSLMAGSGIPLMRGPIRSVLLSQFMQDYYAKPNAVLQRPAAGATMMRLGVQAQGR